MNELLEQLLRSFHKCPMFDGMGQYCSGFVGCGWDNKYCAHLNTPPDDVCFEAVGEWMMGALNENNSNK